MQYTVSPKNDTDWLIEGQTQTIKKILFYTARWFDLRTN